ncbi:MAG: ABC transporter permease, partial [[Ruminococcus] torques]
YLYMTADAYEAVYNEKPEYNAVFYKTVSGTTKEAQSVGEDILQLPGALSVSYTTDLKQQVDDMLGALDIVIVVLTISAGMLAFVVLYNLNNINITERKRELATLKVLGFYPNEVSAYVYRENIVLTVLGALFGVALGKILHRFIIVTVEIDTVMFGRNIDMSSFVYSFLLTVAFSMIVNGAMYFKLKKINMVESLKSVE